MRVGPFNAEMLFVYNEALCSLMRVRDTVCVSQIIQLMILNVITETPKEQYHCRQLFSKPNMYIFSQDTLLKHDAD